MSLPRSPTDSPAGHVGRYGVDKEARLRSTRQGSGCSKNSDVVALKREVPGIPLAASTNGTVVMVYSDNPMHYEVEFSDSTGNFHPGTYTVCEDDLTLIWEYDSRRE